MPFSIFNPLEQFDIIPLAFIGSWWIDKKLYILSFTNSHFFLFLTFLIFLFFYFLVFFFMNYTVKPKIFQYFLEQIFLFINQLLLENITDNKISRFFFPWIFFIFLSITLMNLSGAVPYSFTVTAHLIITFTIALCVFIGVTIIGIKKYKIEIFQLFLPKGISLLMAPFLVLIELLSYFIKVISLSVRLFANMMSGHILLKVIIGFAWLMSTSSIFLYYCHFVPIIILFLLIGLEIGVALIQAYIFTTLICIYLNDVLNINH
jgi:ATP synthase subunit 6